jgi:predicted membrane protein
MLVLADQATNQTIALLITFVGIGVLVNILVIYIVAQVLAERRENQERQQRLNR